MEKEKHVLSGGVVIRVVVFIGFRGPSECGECGLVDAVRVNGGDREQDEQVSEAERVERLDGGERGRVLRDARQNPLEQETQLQETPGLTEIHPEVRPAIELQETHRGGRRWRSFRGIEGRASAAEDEHLDGRHFGQALARDHARSQLHIIRTINKLLAVINVLVNP